MDLQTLFYTVGIIFMVVVLTIIFGVGFSVYLIKKRVDRMKRDARRPIDMGTSFILALINKAREFVKNS